MHSYPVAAILTPGEMASRVGRMLVSVAMQRIRTCLANAALLLTAITSMALAQERTPVDVSKLGPQVGERIPEFTLPDQDGQLQSLESVRGPNGSLILFHRSADW